MVTSLVYQRSDAEGEQSISHSQKVELQGGNLIVYDHKSEILDINVDGVAKEQTLHGGGKGVNGVEDSGHVHQKHGEHAPKILHIAEEYEEGGEDQTHAEVEDDQGDDGNDQQKERPGEADAVDNAEDEEDAESQPEVDQRGNVPREEEEVFRNVDLGEDSRVGDQRAHSAAGGVREE